MYEAETLSLLVNISDTFSESFYHLEPKVLPWQWLTNKKVLWKNLIFDRTVGLKLEMTSYSDTNYELTYFFVLKSSLLILYSYQVSLLSDTKWQIKLGRLFAPLHYRGILNPIQNPLHTAITFMHWDFRAIASGGGGGHTPKPADIFFKTPKFKSKATC